MSQIHWFIYTFGETFPVPKYAKSSGCCFPAQDMTYKTSPGQKTQPLPCLQDTPPRPEIRSCSLIPYTQNGLFFFS